MGSAFVPTLNHLPYRRRGPNVSRHRPQRAPRMQTWSDPSVTQDYLDFLSGVNQREATTDCQSTIVGNGRIGEFLQRHGAGDDLVITRGCTIPPDAPGPVYLCTRNDSLEEIVSQCPDLKRDDLVFLQNGMLEPFLQRYGLSENTRANVYFAVTSRGGDAIDGVTTMNPEGLTSVTGKWEGAFASRLSKAGLSCKLLKRHDYRRANLEKLIWIAAFNLVGAVHGGITMGDVADRHTAEVTDMCRELSTMVRFSLTVGMLSDVEERLCAYARSVRDFPTALKEFEWRNG